MPDSGDRPYAGCNFLVDLGNGKSDGVGAGFHEIVFPEFRLDGQAGNAKPPSDAPVNAAPDRKSSPHLILRRGVTGARDLYEWWNKARAGRAPKGRIVTVTLLAADRASAVMSWRFTQTRPVSLTYTPLNAISGAVLMESIELEFESVEIR